MDAHYGEIDVQALDEAILATRSDPQAPSPDPQLVLSAAFAWVARTRELFGLPALERFAPAVPKDTRRCLIARALSDGEQAGSMAYWHSATAGQASLGLPEHPQLSVPPHVAYAAWLFDSKAYRELETKH